MYCNRAAGRSLSMPSSVVPPELHRANARWEHSPDYCRHTEKVPQYKPPRATTSVGWCGQCDSATVNCLCPTAEGHSQARQPTPELKDQSRSVIGAVSASCSSGCNRWRQAPRRGLTARSSCSGDGTTVTESATGVHSVGRLQLS